ncbi:MAG: GNAT family N-acetyltransferase [Planctomycetaceae bacterium]|nr:GNAT family N-acetyltransferase [Planctomycetaceae bacterium]
MGEFQFLNGKNEELMKAVLIRRATESDHLMIVDFNCRLAEETEAKQLERDIVTDGVLSGLEQPDDVQYWLAEVDGETVGQLMLTREWSDWRNGWIVWLQSVYVSAPHRRSGVFRQLFAHVRDACRSDPSVVGLRLYVEQENDRAVQTYQALGFRDAGYRVLEDLF